MKLIGFLATGIMVLLADALHSASDIIIFSFLLAAAVFSRKEVDKEHMFGHGRAQNAAAFVAATLFISFTSFSLYREAIPRFFQTGESTYQSPILALGVIGAVMVVQAIPMVKLFLQKARSAAGRATLLEMLNDQLSTVAALIGAMFIIWGKPIIDPIATIAVASLITFNGVRLFGKNFSFLLGRSLGSEFMEKVKELASSIPGVLDVHELRTEYVGPETVHVGMHIKVKQGLSIEEANKIVEEVKDKVRRSIDMVASYCYIHVDSEESDKVS